METVESHSRRAVSSVVDDFDARPYRYSFHQAMRLAEALVDGQGTELSPAIRLRARVYLTTPGSDVASWSRGSSVLQGSTPELVVNFLGLAGIQGPLPMFVTEQLLEDAQKKNFARRDFLDVFNHRFLTYFRAIGRRYTPGVAHVPSESLAQGESLRALIGLEVSALRQRMRVDDRGLLPYAGLVWQRPRSLAGLRTMVASYFNIPVAAIPFQGRWLDLEESQWTRLSTQRSETFNRLGWGAALGTRVWDSASRFRLVIGPLSLKSYRVWFQDGAMGRCLQDLIAFYAGPEFEAEVFLRVDTAEIPATRLGFGSVLGYQAWLRTKNSHPIEENEVFLYTKRFQNVNLSAQVVE